MIPPVIKSCLKTSTNNSGWTNYYQKSLVCENSFVKKENQESNLGNGLLLFNDDYLLRPKEPNNF